MDKTIVLALCLVVISATVFPVAGLLPKEAGISYQGIQNDVDSSDGRGLKDLWPMFRNDAGNSGCTPNDSPNTNHVVWKHQIGNEIYQSTPIIYGDNLYISTSVYFGQPPKIDDIFNLPPSPPSEIFSRLIEHQNDAASGLYCLNAITGEQLWFRPMNAPNNPAIVDDKLYVTAVSSSSYDSYLYCLDAATGDVLWMRTISGWALSSTIVSNEKIFVGCIDIYSYYGSVKCYDLSGTLLWNHYLSEYEALWFSSPACSGDYVYFITSDIYYYYTGTVYCLSAATGQYIWSHPVFTFGYYFYGTPSPVCFDSKVYVADFNIDGYEGFLKCYDGATGTLTWSCYLGPVLSCASPAVSDNGAFITGSDLYSYNTWLYKINSGNGSYLWRVALPASSYFGFGSPVCSVDKIIVSPGMYYGYSNDIFCFDREDGSQIWKYTLDTYTFGSPSIGDGRLYITDMNGNIYAFKDALKIPIILGGFLGVNALIKNIGDTSLTNITWTITVMGGSMGMVNRTRTGTIQELQSGRSKMVRVLPVVGIGPIEITVQATLPDTSMLKIVKQGKIFGSVSIVLP